MSRIRDFQAVLFAMVPLICLLLADAVWAAPRVKSAEGQEPGMKSTVISHEHFDGNSIDCTMTNDGAVVDARVTGSSGMEWPNGTYKTIDYASGLWLAGIGHDDSNIHTACVEYVSELVPGPWGGNPYDAAYRIYKINKDGTGDWDVWPEDQGAPVNSVGDPMIIGDQTLFWVCNDGNVSQHGNVFGTAPMGVEFRCTVFGFDLAGPLGNTMFVKWELIHRGSQQFDSCFVALWDDPDLGDASNDLVGCDTTLGLGYCYNGNPTDVIYGSSPPAIGFDFFQGPEMPKGSGNYLPMTSFSYWWNGAPDPYDDPETASEAYCFMNGCKGDGTSYLDHQGHETRFVFAGDPVTGTGHLDSSPSDRRFMMSSGPFTLSPGDTHVVVGAKIIAQGTDNLNSIAELRSCDAYVHDFYDDITAVESADEPGVFPAHYRLSQNYPNPFNPETTVRFRIPQAGSVSLRVYNVKGQLIRVLIDGRRSVGSYEVAWDGRDEGGRRVASGLYFCRMQAADFSKTVKMVLVK